MNVLVAVGALCYIALSNAGPSMHNPNYCYMKDPIRPLTNMMSLTTSYEAIRRFNFTGVNPYASTCIPSRIWYIGRYGGGLPGPATLGNMLSFADSTIQQDIVNSYAAGRTTLCSEDFEAIRTWTKQENYTLENAYMPSDSSIVQMQNIARRYQQAFPTILTDTYSRERFFFRNVLDERCNSSIRAFATGLFGEEGAQNVFYEDSPDRDPLLAPFDACPQFNEEIGWETAERETFFEGPEFEELHEQVNRKLGLIGTNRLSIPQMVAMWNWCRYETSTSFEFSNSPIGGDHAWCAPFSMAHHQLMEYSDDLWSFHIFGYGQTNQRLIQNLHCALYQDLLAHLQSNDEPRVRVFVALQQQVISVLTYLGVFRDVWPFHRHNYAQHVDRQWRDAVNTPFASNLAIVRYDCEDGNDDVLFYLNERPILVPGCDRQTGACKLNTIVRTFERFINVDCETHFCSNN